MGFRTIILDDDENSRESLSILLRRRNHEVHSFADPTLCPLFEDPECCCPRDHACGDFLITDNKMPGMSGLDFVQRQIARQCRGVVKNKAILSGSWTGEERKLAKRLGCKLFTKPLVLEEFWDWLGGRERCIPPGRKLIGLP
jgi:CheY-like chemotaxis protein